MIKKRNGTYVVTYSTRDKFGRKVKRQQSGISSLAKARRVESEFISELTQSRNGFDYAGLSFIEFLNKHYLTYCHSSFSDAERASLRLDRARSSAVFAVALCGPAAVALADSHRGNWLHWRGPLQSGASLERYDSARFIPQPVWTHDLAGRGMEGDLPLF